MTINKIRKIISYTFLIIATIISVFPFYYMMVSATNKSIDVTRGRLLPGTHLLENFRNLLDTVDIVPAFINSTIISIFVTFFALLIASLAGYAFEIYQSRLKELVFNILLSSMMIPFSALMIPLYRMFSSATGKVPFTGINHLSAVILPTLTTAFLIFFFRQNTKMFSKDLIEAARIDGLSELGIFFKIYMPTMKSTYAAGAIITFMNSWNNYLWPLIILQSPDKQTIPLLLSNLGASYSPDYGLMMLAIFIATLPIAIIFIIMQKHFVAGMMGAVK